jgi:hypothetical protein
MPTSSLGSFSSNEDVTDRIRLHDKEAASLHSIRYEKINMNKTIVLFATINSINK